MNQSVQLFIAKLALLDISPLATSLEEELYELTSELPPTFDPDEIDQIFNFIEKNGDNAYFGSPGPLIHYIEKCYPAAVPRLLDSIAKQPTTITVQMARRIVNSPKIAASIRMSCLEALRKIVSDGSAERFVIYDACTALDALSERLVEPSEAAANTAIITAAAARDRARWMAASGPDYANPSLCWSDFVEIIGTREDSLQLIALLEKIDEAPVKSRDRPYDDEVRRTYYTFKRLGAMISFIDQAVESVDFMLAAEDIEFYSCARYEGPFPPGISADANEVILRDKLGIPFQTGGDDYWGKTHYVNKWFTYSYGTYEIRFEMEKQSGKICRMQLRVPFE